MSNTFKPFARLVQRDVTELTKHRAVFEVNLDRDALFALYLASFPEGSNPLFKTRTEHDCSCCKSFVRAIGGMVTINDDGTYNTVWDSAAQKAEEPYRTVALALRDFVRTRPVAGLFRKGKSESSSGNEETRSMFPDGHVVTWSHFFSGKLPTYLLVNDFSEVARVGTSMETCARGFKELKPAAVDTVLELIDQNAIYRGAEFGGLVQDFRRLQRVYFDLDEAGPARSKHVAKTAFHLPAVAGFRSTVIGTLVQDLSEGKPLEDAVRAYESKVAPQNYKRPTALVTPRMIEQAMGTIRELGLEEALERRLARLEDVSVQDVLWVNGTTTGRLKGGLEGMLLEHAKKPKAAPAHGAEIKIDDFVRDVLPSAKDVEVLFENSHLGNLMVLTAPQHEGNRKLFKWDNDFAWSYGGNVTDAVRERVKRAGGNVDNAVLRVSLAWSNTDDLDLHCEGPGEHIYFGDKRSRLSTGHLDVDMNVRAESRQPVENISWEMLPSERAYLIRVHSFTLRERSDVGFTLQVFANGTTHEFTYENMVNSRQYVDCLTLVVGGPGGKVQITNVNPALKHTERSQRKWGLSTGSFVRVNAVTLSPNFWGQTPVGNKHVFFVLEGCSCDEPMRGIYNEFLSARLEEHRKVFELIGEKTKCAPTPGHIAGIGFSSTRTSDEVTVRVDGGRVYKIRP